MTFPDIERRVQFPHFSRFPCDRGIGCIYRLGHTRFVPCFPERRKTVIILKNYERLIKDGHSATLESIYNSNQVLLERRIHHDLTCRQCIKDRQKL